MCVFLKKSIKNGAHLVEEMMFKKNKDCPLSIFKCSKHVKKIHLCQALNI